VDRNKLLVSRQEFDTDLSQSYEELRSWGISKYEAHYYLPPYEWYNDSIVDWTNVAGLQLVCFTPGTRSSADYTYPEMGSKYAGSKEIFSSIVNYEKQSSSGLNGFILLVHIGTDPRRTDKFYLMLPDLITLMKRKGYQWVKINELLGN
jgi:peptidoglycan/xylan/chitin deacetylase (PgdA/CDA1 family)